MKQENMRVYSHRHIAEQTYELVLEGELASFLQAPGQFLHIKPPGGELLLRRPLSIAKAEPELKHCTVLYRVEGKGTQQLTALSPGDTLNVLGPMGNGFPIAEAQLGETALLTGGGIGVPPLYELGRQLKQKGLRVVSVLGFSDRQAVFYEEQFRELGEVFVATDDGSYGRKGFVTDVISQEALSFDWLFTCGPKPMLAALTEQHKAAKGYISLEERMGCGFGACLACVCEPLSPARAGQTFYKICKDGPVFPLREVKL
ncbi:dihydroorotate dehydrogenase electron transfer subunit [Salsuginibacillus kocurii]|uniref:dihydroorotate dehydrogenase electron transfer subunit n=1 Tax=Salsuginibacillus kocurii TaxID=427078 RepID=UPI000363697C|nr:dihydroorotate dehydrogenase electron transfer subunit [Salsuginibacillus kocurii]